MIPVLENNNSEQKTTNMFQSKSIFSMLHAAAKI